MMQSTNVSGDRWSQGQQGHPEQERVLAEIRRSPEFYYVAYGPTVFDKEQVAQKPAPGQEGTTSRFEMLREIPCSFGDLDKGNIVIAQVFNRFHDIRGGGDLVVTLNAHHRDNTDARHAIQLACQINGTDLDSVANFLCANPAALQHVMAIFDSRFRSGELLTSNGQKVSPLNLHVIENPRTQKMEWRRGLPPRPS
jgi:hypothetical protein